jgi:hypothetical protein
MNSQKTYFFFSVILLLLSLAIGCKSVNTVIDNVPQVAGSMTATVNGQAWASTATDSAYSYGGAYATLNKPLIGALTITGVSVGTGTTSIQNPPTQTVTIALINPHLGADSMSIANSFDPNTGSFLYGTNSKDAYVTRPTAGNTAGYIDITKYDTVNMLISGTFSFTATQLDTISHTITITNGSFYDVSW